MKIPPGNIPDLDEELFQSAGKMTISIPLNAGLVDWWNIHILQPYGLTPESMTEMLLKDLHWDERIEFYRLDLDPQRQVLQLGITGSEGGNLVYIAGQSLFLTEVNDRTGVADALATALPGRHIEIDLLDVEPAFQGRGISAALMANVYELAKALEITKLSVEAYLTGGPYAWLSYGFQPKEDYWPDIKKRIEAKLVELGDRIPEKVRERLVPILGSGNPRAVFGILDEDMKVVSRASDGKDREISLSRALLADTDQRWYGVLDLEDRNLEALFVDCITRNKR